MINFQGKYDFDMIDFNCRQENCGSRKILDPKILWVQRICWLKFLAVMSSSRSDVATQVVFQGYFYRVVERLKGVSREFQWY